MTRPLLGPILQAMAFKGKGREITDFIMLYSQYPLLANKHNTKIYSNVWWRINSIHLLTFISSLPIAFRWIVCGEDFNLSITSYVSLCVHAILMNYVILFSPLMAGKLTYFCKYPVFLNNNFSNC